MTGASLPAGDGVLATLSFAATNDGATLSASNVTLSSSEGVTLASSGPGSTATDGCYETDCAGTCYGDAEDLACGCNDADSCNDCAGVPNGDSWESDCGCVAADNSGDDCDDCAGVPNGDSVVDLSLIHI